MNEQAPGTVALDDLAKVIEAYADCDTKAKRYTKARDGLRRILDARMLAARAELGTVDGRPRLRRTRYLERRVDAARLREQAGADLVTACTVENERVRLTIVAIEAPIPPEVLEQLDLVTRALVEHLVA
jgi:hypothetical protein